MHSKLQLLDLRSAKIWIKYDSYEYGECYSRAFISYSCFESRDGVRSNAGCIRYYWFLRVYRLAVDETVFWIGQVKGGRGFEDGLLPATFERIVAGGALGEEVATFAFGRVTRVEGEEKAPNFLANACVNTA